MPHNPTIPKWILTITENPDFEPPQKLVRKVESLGSLLTKLAKGSNV